MDECPECGEELEYLDTIVSKSTGKVFCHLYVCHNEECNDHGLIYNDRDGELRRGDPSGELLR